MTLRYQHIILAVFILLTSCANEGVQEVGHVISFRLVSESVEVVQTDSLGITRAVDGVNDNSTFIFPADFSVAVDGETFVYTANDNVNNMTSSAPASYPISGNSVKVQAFYPSFKVRYATMPQTFTVVQNQCQASIGTAGYRVSDLMYGVPKSDFAHLDGSGKVEPSADAIPLVFEHKMVKILIAVTTNGATVKGITMKNVKRSIDFNTADATFTNLATAADGLGDNVIMYNDATGTSADFICTALIPTQSLAANTQFIDVVIDAQPTDLTYTYKLSSATTFASGKQYNYRLSVSMTEVPLDCEITNWNTTPAGWTNISETLTI